MKKGSKVSSAAAVVATDEKNDELLVKKPTAAKRAPRKTTKKSNDVETATSTTSSTNKPAVVKEKKPPAKQQPVTNTLMNYIKPGCHELGMKKPTPIIKKPKSERVGFVDEPPNEQDLFKLINQSSLTRAKLAEVDVKKLIESWQSDADDFELFDLNTSVKNAGLLESGDGGGGDQRSDESIIERYERIFIGMERELEEEEEKEKEEEEKMAAVVSMSISGSNQQLTAAAAGHNLTSQHLNSVINDTLEIAGSFSSNMVKSSDVGVNNNDLANLSVAKPSKPLINMVCKFF